MAYAWRDLQVALTFNKSMSISLEVFFFSHDYYKPQYCLLMMQ